MYQYFDFCSIFAVCKFCCTHNSKKSCSKYTIIFRNEAINKIQNVKKMSIKLKNLTKKRLFIIRRDERIAKEYANSMSQPGSMSTAVIENLCAKYGFKSRKSIYNIINKFNYESSN